MPASNPTIITAHLDDKELRKSIDELVSIIDKGLGNAALNFDAGISLMESSLKRFHNNAKSISQDLRSSFKEMGVSFDAISHALQKNTTGGKSSSARSTKNIDYISLESDAQKGLTYLINANKDVDAQLANILQKESEIIAKKQQEVQETHNAATAQQGVTQSMMGTAQILGSVHQMQQRANQSAVSYNNTLSSQFMRYEDLRSAIAAVLGVGQNSVYLADAENDSYKKLSQTLNLLKQTYDRLNSTERNSENGRALIASMHEVERSMQKIRSQASRPLTLESILGINNKGGLSEKTLDDIMYKMKMLSAYRSGIDLTDKSKVSEINAINKKYAELQKKQSEVMGQNSKLVKSNEMLGRSFDYIKNRLAFIFTIGASTNFVKQIYDIRGQYELLERSIGILFDSMQEGTHIFAELNAMAIKSPFTTMELGTAAKQLSAYNIAAKDVVDTTKRIADMAAAVGVPIERLTYALGQIKAYGYLNARDARMFANAGIPLVQNLADMYTKLEGRLVSIGDVYDRIKKKAISFEDVLKVVNEMTDEGGRFFNFQEKAADTLKVKLANLTLAYNNMLNELGKSNQGLLTLPLKALKNLFESWRNIANIIKSVIVAYGLLKAVQIFVVAYMQKVSLATAAADVSSKRLVATTYTLRNAFMALAKNPFTWVLTAVSYLGYLFFQMKDLSEETKNLNKSISDSAKENIKSIEKFFDEYKKDIDTIESLSVSEQEKMWERIKDEIEKTSRSAEYYISLLEQIPNVSERITKSSDFLSQIQQIQQEAQRLADLGYFSAGGGFADKGLADDLIEYEEITTKLIRKYESIQGAREYFGGRRKTLGDIKFKTGWGEYLDALGAVNKELNNFIEVLDKADISKILGGGDVKEQMVNIREFSSFIRDQFLATERGQKVSAEGRAMLNKRLDEWISKQGVANGLISEEESKVESARTAWENFFGQLNKQDKEALNYLVETGQYSSKEFQDIWDKATKGLKESSGTFYNQIQEQIANLRNTPDIIIRVVYRQEKDSLDEQQKQFKKDFLTPVGDGILPVEEFSEKYKQLNVKYGRFQKKENEDNVEWEKRLGEEYQKNEASIKRLNAQLKNSASLSEVDKNAKEKDLKLLVETNNALDEIAKRQNFNYEKETKGSKKDVLGEAFQKEIEVIGNIQKRYKEYKAAGVDAQTAITKATNEYAKTLANTNATLNRYGVKTTKNGNELANMDLRDLRDYYTYLLDMAQKVNNVKGVEALEKAIAGLNVEITKIDYKKITDGLNNELGKLKDEYELGIELDANPELGNIFADMLGINSEELQKLPKDFEGVVSRLQTVIDQKLGAGKFNLFKNLNKAAFDAWLEQNQQGTEQDDAIAKQLNAIREYANKVRLDESKKQIEEWNKLLEKYAEYEYKITQIQKQAQRERDAAIKKGAPQDVINAINNWEKQQIAGVAFEEFQKSPEWILATGNLANMSRQSIGMLIGELENYKKSAKNLSPKQIKELNNALTKLYKEQRKNSPFHAISDMIDEAKDRMGVFDEEINKTKEEIDKLTKKKNKNLAENIIDDKTDKALDKAINKLKELQKKKEEAGKVDATDWVSAINETISAVQSAVGVFNDLSKAIGGVNKNDVDKVFSVLSSAGQGAAIGAQVGGGWGALIGGLAGAATSIISLVSSASNEKITDKVEESERAVKRLELAYIDLEHAINEAYGTGAFGAQRLAVANKELQLAELNRQLELEKSRKRKDRDEDKIIDIQKQIRELEYDIMDSVNSITNDLLGISSVGDAMENLMDGFVEALRSGENAMNVFDESIDDMIANMVKKMFTTKILQPWFEEQWNAIQKDIDSRGTDIAAQIKELQKRRLDLEESSDSLVMFYDKERVKQWIEELDKQIADLESQMITATMPTKFDIKKYAEMLRSGQPILEDNLADIQEFLRELGLMNDTKNGGLSALQQGIQGVTENTASAIEAYMNIVSQRVFEQNVYLREIRDHVSSFDLDIQLGTQSQMLLQLQQSYTVQLAIQNILNGALNPSGRAFMVELNS